MTYRPKKKRKSPLCDAQRAFSLPAAVNFEIKQNFKMFAAFQVGIITVIFFNLLMSQIWGQIAT